MHTISVFYSWLLWHFSKSVKVGASCSGCNKTGIFEQNEQASFFGVLSVAKGIPSKRGVHYKGQQHQM